LLRPGHAETARLKSPNGRIEANLMVRENRLHWRLHHDGQTVLQGTPLGITIDVQLRAGGGFVGWFEPAD